MNKIILSLLLLVIIRTTGYAQSVGIGTASPDASALLELKTTSKGFLPPRMTAAEKALIPSPKAGLLIYQTDATPGLYTYNGSSWVAVAGAAGNGWSLNGNGGTNPANNFIGTTDNQPLHFRVNNAAAGVVNADDENVALGASAFENNSAGIMNNAIGSQALNTNSTGFHNNALGRRALFANTTGTANVAIGSSALAFNLNGNGNVAMGFYAAFNNVSGFSNIAIGTQALYKSESGSRLIAIGDSALYNNTTVENVAIGSKSLYSNSNGVFNTGVGNLTLSANTSGSQNTALGRGAMFYNSAGSQNTAIGFQALHNNLYAGRNTAVGYNSLLLNETGSDNTAVGYNTLLKSTAGSNTAVGSQALTESTTGVRSTAIGYTALQANTSGSFNTAVGYGAIRANVDGSNNTSLGDFSMINTVNGSFNTALGSAALNKNISGNYNTGIGYKAEVHNSNYSNATAVGAFAEAGCSDCVVLGSVSGYNGAAVTAKTGIGTVSPQKTLHVNPNGPGGISIGNDLTTGGFTSMNMGISQASGGYSFIQSVKAAWPSPTYGNLVLNQSGGFVGIGKASPSTPLHIKQSSDNAPYNGGLRLERHDNGNGWDISVSYADVLHLVYNGVEKVRFSNIDGDIWTSSDLRLKKDIRDFGTALPKLMKLKARSYHYKDNDDAAPLSYGFIAQEVEQVFPGAVSSAGHNGMKAVAYQKLNILAIQSIQEQQVMIEAQQKEIDLLKQQHTQLQDSIIKLQKALEEIRADTGRQLK